MQTSSFHRRRQTVPTAILAAGGYHQTQSVRRSPSQPAAPLVKSCVEGRLASSARYCRYRVRDPADSRNRRLSPVQRVRTSQLREAPHGAPVPADTGASERILLAATGKSETQSTREKERRIRRRRCIIPATVLTSGAHLCSLSVPVSPTPSVGISFQSDWFSLRRIAERRATPVVCSQLFASGTSTNSSLVSVPGKPWELPDLDDSPPIRWLGPPGTPAVANSADRASLRDGTSHPSEISSAVRANQHCGLTVPRNNQHFTSLQCTITSSLHHFTTQTIIISPIFPAPFLSKPCDLLRTRSRQHPRTSALTTGHHRSTSTNTLTGTLTNMPRNSGMKCSGKNNVSGLSSQRRSRAVGTACQPSTQKTKKRRSVPPRLGDSTKHHKLAHIATRSTAAQTVNPVSDGASRADVYSDQIHSLPDAEPFGGRALAAAVALQRKYWLLLQRVQHSIQQTLEQSLDPSRRPTARSPTTAVLEQLRYRSRSISQDMRALNRICCVEMATSTAPQGSRRVAVRPRASQTRLTRTTQK